MGDHAGRGSHGDDDAGRSSDGDHGRGAGNLVTFDQIDFTTYLHSNVSVDTSFSEHFILQVNGFEFDGSPVNLPGFGTHFGMYFLIDATGHVPASGAATFDTMNIALMVDRGNNDGVPSSTESGGATFSNGTSGDYALATGTLFSAGISVDPDGTRHPDFIQQITPTEAGERLFGDSLDPGALLEELLTTPGGPTTINVGGGNTIQLVNGQGAGGVAATGIAELSSHAPLTMRPGELSEGFHGCGF